jgi:hypothetical protein
MPRIGSFFGVAIDPRATPWSAAHLSTALRAVQAKAALEVDLALAHLETLAPTTLDPSVRGELEGLARNILDRRK